MYLHVFIYTQIYTHYYIDQHEVFKEISYIWSFPLFLIRFQSQGTSNISIISQHDRLINMFGYLDARAPRRNPCIDSVGFL